MWLSISNSHHALTSLVCVNIAIIGVLLLNTVLTVEAGKIKSHSKKVRAVIDSHATLFYIYAHPPFCPSPGLGGADRCGD